MRLSAFHKFIIGFCFSLVLLFSIISFSYKSGNELYNDFTWVEHSYKVIHTLEKIVSLIRGTEVNLNRYSVNPDAALLVKYERSVKEIYTELRQLKIFIAEDQTQKENVEELITLVNKRVELFNYTIKFRKKEQQHPFLIHSKLDEANLCMTQINEIKMAIENDQQILIKHRHKTAYKSFINTNIINIAAALFCLLIATLGIVIMQKDIKERSLTEKDLRKMDENKNKFFSIISHDLRGPMKAILKLSKFLTDEKNKPTPEDAGQIAKLIEKTSGSLSVMLDNLLSWSRIQMNNIDFKPETLNLAVIIEESISTLYDLAEIKKISLHNYISSDAVAFADKNMLNTIVRNLTSNSIKFTKDGGTIKITSSKTEDSFIEIIVEDNGIGMTNDEISRLFEIKTRYSKKGTANEEGSGLGLLLCKEFAEKNGGEIKVESTINVGTKFKFTLPLHS